MSNGAPDPQPTLAAYFANCREETYQKGEVVSGGARRAEGIFYVSGGYAKGYTIDDEGNSHILVIKGPGDIFPVSNLFTREEANVYYASMSLLSVRKTAKDRFEADLQRDPSLALAVIEKLAGIMRDNTNRLQNLEISDGRQRVIFRLLFLAGRFGARSKRGREVVFLPVTYPDLADSINLTRETVNRIVSQLEKEGLVKKTRGRITILDKGKLLAEVDGFHS